MNEAFWKWDKDLRASYKRQLDNAFEELKNCRHKAGEEAIRNRIAQLKADQQKERIFRETYQAYAKAASIALRSGNQEDAELCLEQMQELTLRCVGYWQEGWSRGAGSFSLVGNAVKSRITWKQITEADLLTAQKVWKSVQEEAIVRKAAASEFREVPMPIETKLHRGEISFRHPDSARWVRGKRLGNGYTLDNLGVSPPRFLSGHDRSPTYEYSR